ncbi:ribonuclease III [Aeromicrobium sp. SMF47]|uniref:Ribonuclease 3 n=1 Tax=Aeromicrobium yanjiei TaxID=2662028 RepID=A0A5Q2MJE5_9ACTN|nr:ribonuclease III [Aeromicrobium yanjiei]MRK02319.1 ribonuclease III [Aeromicrobium sp. S22]QGG43187.1 ribonuclease III [Aeromicrobium yanjiei]
MISAAADAGALREVLGVQDLDPELLQHALTHRSYAYENGGVPNNERLEFLGDSVLGLVVTDTLFTEHPDLPEGQLAKLRAAVVSAKALAEVARTLGIGEHVRLGRGEETTGGRDKASILSDTVEAILGAIYVQFGIERAAMVIHRVFDPVIADAAKLGAGLDWKTSLQEISANNDLGVPHYVLVGTGPDHNKSFTAEVVVGERTFSGGAGRSKKEAEQMVAEIAWREINAGLDQPVS